MLLRLYLERRICLVELGNLWRSRRDRFGKELLFPWPDLFCVQSAFQFELCEFCQSAPPAWCVQVLMEFLYFLQSSHLCLSFWSHTECDETSSGNSVHRICLLPTQQAYPGFLSAWGMSCLGHSLHSPCPTQKLGVELQGYLQTHLCFWCNCKLQMSPVTPDFFYGKLLCMGFRGELVQWSVL